MDFVIPIAVAVFFFLAKVIEMKYIDRQPKPLKNMVRDAIIVFLVTLVVVFLYSNYSYLIHNMFHIVTDNKSIPFIGQPEIFTDKPEF